MKNIRRLINCKLEVFFVNIMVDLDGQVMYTEILRELKNPRSIPIVDSLICNQVKTDLAKIKRQEIKI